MSVNGNTTYDVPVTPYFTIAGETFAVSMADTSITATCNITKVGTRNISNLTIYVGVTSIVDNTNSGQNVALTTGLTDLSTPKTVKVKLSNVTPLFLNHRNYVYVRLGIQISGVNERYFTPVKKIMLQ